MSVVKSLLNSFSEAVFPPRCAVCGLVLADVVCRQCEQALVREEIHTLNPVGFVDEVRAAFAYEQTAAEMVKALKYRRETALLHRMAGDILDLYLGYFSEVDVVVPVPIHHTRLAWRGFNQALGLCERLPAHLVQSDLVRTRRTAPQVKLDPVERATNLEGAFACRELPRGARVLLVDDVFTTGATAGECARALREAGATYVAVACFAAKRRTTLASPPSPEDGRQ